MKREIENRPEFTSIANDTEKVRTIGDEFVVDLKDDISKWTRIYILTVPGNVYLQVIKRSSDGFLEDGFIEIRFELHNTRGSLLLESELVETTYHPLAHLSANFRELDFEILIRSESCSDRRHRDILCLADIVSSADDISFPLFSEVQLHEIQMIRIGMRLRRDYLCHEDSILLSDLLDRIDLGSMDGVEMGERFRTVIGKSLGDIRVHGYPGERYFH